MIWQMRSECPLTLGEYQPRVVFQIPFCSLTLMDLTVRYSTATHIRNPVCLVYTSHLTLCQSDVRVCMRVYRLGDLDVGACHDDRGPGPAHQLRAQVCGGWLEFPATR